MCCVQKSLPSDLKLLPSWQEEVSKDDSDDEEAAKRGGVGGSENDSDMEDEGDRHEDHTSSMDVDMKEGNSQPAVKMTRVDDGPPGVAQTSQANQSATPMQARAPPGAPTLLPPGAPPGLPPGMPPGPPPGMPPGLPPGE